MDVPAAPQRSGVCIWVAWAAVLLLAAVLRLGALDRYPAPVNQDELSNIYDGWSIAETGADRSGRRLPILCYGFGQGDNRPALMAWLCAGAHLLGGFSVAGGRAVSGVLGTATVALAGLWALRRFGHRGAILTMVLLAVSPWHLLYSRLAHEGSALPGFFCAAILLLLSVALAALGGGLRRACWWWGLAGLVIGFSTNAYGATRLSALLFAILATSLLVGAGRTARLPLRRVGAVLLTLVVATAVGAGPQLWAFACDREGFLGRAQQEAIQPTGLLNAVTTVAGNLVDNLRPDYLFASFGTGNNLAVGLCSLAEAPIFYLGLLALILPWRGWPRAERLLVLLAVPICTMPSAVTTANPHALRASACAVLFPMIAAVGAVRGGQWALAGAARLGAWRPSQRSRERAASVAASLLVAVALAFGGSYVRRYVRSPALIRLSQHPELVETGIWLSSHQSGYDRVYLEYGNIGYQPDLYVAAFGGMPPSEFRRAYRSVVVFRGIEFCRQMNQFWFTQAGEARRDWRASDGQGRWLVLTPGKPPLELGPVGSAR